MRGRRRSRLGCNWCSSYMSPLLPHPPRSWVVSFRSVDRNGNPHCGPHTRPAADIESRIDFFRPRAHPAKPPVRIALFLNGFRIDSAAIVMNAYTCEVAQVLNFNVDVCRFGMAQRVHDRFPADQKNLLLDGGSQCPRLSLNDNSKLYTRAGGDFFQKVGKGLI